MNISREWKWGIAGLMFVIGAVLFRGDSASRPVATFIGNGMFVALVVWGYLHCRNSRDEVVRAANVAAMAVGAPLGLGLAFVSVFAFRFFPSFQELLLTVVRKSYPVEPLTAGFGMGILFTCGLVVLSATGTWFGWWFARR